MKFFKFLIAILLIVSIIFAQDPLLPFVNSIPPVNEVISITTEDGLKLERFTFLSRDSINVVYGILVYPQNITDKLPGVLVFHGGGSRAEQVLGVAKNYARKGFVSLAIDLPHLCNDCPNTTGPFTDLPGGEGPRLNVEGGPENSVLTDAMVAALEGFNYLAAHMKTDSDNMGITGSSWGGYTTTMMSGLLKDRVKAAYSVFGCGFWDKGSFWLPFLNDLSPENRNTWLTYFDAGRRAAHITANYFIDAPTNDVFFWPIAVQATLDTIPGYTNHVYGPNLHHTQTGVETRYYWMEHYLKNETVPGFARAMTYSALENDGGREVTFILDIPNSVSITESKLWYTLPNVPEPDRNWLSLNTQKLDDTTYVAHLSPDMVTDKVKYFGTFRDNYDNWISTEMQFSDKLIYSGTIFEHNLAAVRSSANLNNIPIYAKNIAPEFVIGNYGLSEEFNIPIHCEIRSENGIVYSDTITIDKIKSFEVDTVVFKGWHPSECNTYDIIFYSQLLNDEDRYSDTLKLNINITNYMDDFESDFGNWTSNGTWGVDNREAYNGQYSLAVNPGYYYESNINTFAQYRYSFDLTSINNPQLYFWSQTSMPAMAGSDHGFVEISIDGGLNWEKIGNNYFGSNTTWECQIIPLQDFAEYENISIRFHFISDMMFNGKGWFIDDIKIEEGSTGIKDETGSMPLKYNLYENYPNPFNPSTIIQYRIPKNENVELRIYNMLGESVVTLVDKNQKAGAYSVDFNSNGLSSGIYIYQVKAGNFIQNKKMLLVK